jgi:hypothetical protein
MQMTRRKLTNKEVLSDDPHYADDEEEANQ